MRFVNTSYVVYHVIRKQMTTRVSAWPSSGQTSLTTRTAAVAEESALCSSSAVVMVTATGVEIVEVGMRC